MIRYFKNLRNKFVQKCAQKVLDQYVQDALRTESKLEKLRYNPKVVTGLLTMYTELTDLLDGVKKSIFYGKDAKLLQIYRDRMNTIREISGELSELTDEQLLNKCDQDHVNPRFFHGVLGIDTESGELTEILITHMIEGDSPDPIHIQEELGDGMALGWYPAILHDEFELNPKETLDKNIRKLKVRFPDKYTDEAVANRNLTEERKELEK